MVDSDLEVKKGTGFFLLFSVPAFLPFYDFFDQNKGRGDGSLSLPLDPPLQVHKYKEITGFDVYSLDIFKPCFQT